LISGQFLTLPSRRDFPDYYAFTKMPLALDDIEKKVNANRYATITEVESDLRRMVQNAKDYNDARSTIYEDAEKIRKLVYNYMKVNNPAYADSSYVAFPTPISDTNGQHVEETESPPVAATNGRCSETPARSRTATTAPRSEPPESRVSAAPSATSAAVEDDVLKDETENESGVDFVGKTFQQAQEMIISELLAYTDDE
jgi:hypothetical protein